MTDDIKYCNNCNSWADDVLDQECQHQFEEPSKKISQTRAVSKGNSRNLAAHIVVYKSLGIDKDLALLCMEELAKRRANGEDFDFEDFVETELVKIPKIESIDILHISRSIMGNVNSLGDLMKSAQSLKDKVTK